MEALELCGLKTELEGAIQATLDRFVGKNTEKFSLPESAGFPRHRRQYDELPKSLAFKYSKNGCDSEQVTQVKSQILQL